MLEITGAGIEHLILHKTGNAEHQEGFRLSKNELELDEDLQPLLLQYFLSKIKGQFFFRFRSDDAPLKALAASLFEGSGEFVALSAKIASLLHESSTHPGIKPGDLFVCLFRDILFNGEPVEALGVFKSENKDQYLKIFEKKDDFTVQSESGINLNKIDKACLILNAEAEEGYVIAMIDNSKAQDEAVFWKDKFIQAVPREDKDVQTRSFMKLCKDFCEEVLTEDNQVNRQDQMMIKGKTREYLNRKEKVNVEDFAREVLETPEVVHAFHDYKENFFKKAEIQPFEEFEISPDTVKSNKKFLKSVLKLDKNFHIYVHGNHEYLQKGYDEEKNMNFYQLFFHKEL